MADPSAYLPTHTPADIANLLSEIGCTPATKINPLTVSAAFHKIWLLDFPLIDSSANQLPSRGAKNTEQGAVSTEASQAILRVSGPHIPEIKTVNEIGVLTFLQHNTSIPVPRVLHSDCGRDNALGCECMLMTRAWGTAGSEIYESITPQQMDTILQQLVDIQLQLYQHPWDHSGGLEAAPDQPLRVKPGPPVDEWRWLDPDIKKYFPNTETYASLNPTSRQGYPGFAAWIAAHVEKYIHAIEVHEMLHSWLAPKDLRLLRKFLNQLDEPSLKVKLDDVPLRLAHRDLHFGNILLDPLTRNVTCILDWEFAQVLPLPLWRHSFLLSGKTGEGVDRKRERQERERLYNIWVTKVKKTGNRGLQMLNDMEWRHKEQGAAWDVCNYLRCIVEVCPRQVQLQDARRWWQCAVDACGVLDVELENVG